MDKACASKLMDVFESEFDIGEVIRCIGVETLSSIFLSTKGLPDSDFLTAVQTEYLATPGAAQNLHA